MSDDQPRPPANGRRLAWFTDAELAAEVARRRPAGEAPRDDLDALDKLRSAATPGPWVATTPRADGSAYIDQPLLTRGEGPPWVGHASRAHDAALIVAAVNALPDLIAEARKYRALREGLDRLVATAPAMWHGDYPVSAIAVSDLLGIVAVLGGPTT